MKLRARPALPSLQSLVQGFFQEHLTIERNASRNTVLAYRDALKIFLAHASAACRRPVDKLDHRALDVDVVRSFMEHLSTKRRCGPRTRNQRLAAIKSFARYVASVSPEHLDRCRRVRELPRARFQHSEVMYLEEDEVLRIVNAIDPTRGRRDRALILLLYNTGARVQEVVDADVGDVHLDPVACVLLEGKGRKRRTCPLWPRTVDAIKLWLAERGAVKPEDPLFVNTRGARITRSGVAHVLRLLSRRAKLSPRHARRISPHVMRHTTAMHLLQAGADITTIAAWLGHAQLSTTHGYVEINLRMKQEAVAAATALPELAAGEYPSGDLLAWLVSLGRTGRYVQRPEPHGRSRPGKTRAGEGSFT
jgi:integrase/recombinase XerD